MKVVILTEGSSQMGYGHITRCCALYEGFETRDIEPVLLIRGDDSVACLLENKKYHITDWLDSPEKIHEYTQDSKTIVIIDSYHTTYEYLKPLAKRYQNIVYLDDNNRIEYPSGVILNGSPYAQNLAYKKKPSQTYLLGKEYLLLRQPFWHIERKRPSEKIQSILITFGGDDIRNCSPKVTKVLHDHFPEMQFNVIVGGGFSDKTKTALQELSSERISLHYSPDAQKMVSLMQQSDIAISAAGQTLYELQVVGVATIAIQVTENQRNNMQYLYEKGALAGSKQWNEPFLLESIAVLIDRQQSDCHLDIPQLLKGNGVNNVITYLI